MNLEDFIINYADWAFVSLIILVIMLVSNYFWARYVFDVAEQSRQLRYTNKLLEQVARNGGTSSASIEVIKKEIWMGEGTFVDRREKELDSTMTSTEQTSLNDPTAMAELMSKLGKKE